MGYRDAAKIEGGLSEKNRELYETSSDVRVSHRTTRRLCSANARSSCSLRPGGLTNASKKTARSRGDKTIVSCSAIVRRAASASAVMQKSVSLRRSRAAAGLISAFVGSKPKPFVSRRSFTLCRRRHRFSPNPKCTSRRLTFQRGSRSTIPHLIREHGRNGR